MNRRSSITITMQPWKWNRIEKAARLNIRVVSHNLWVEFANRITDAKSNEKAMEGIGNKRDAGVK